MIILQKLCYKHIISAGNSSFIPVYYIVKIIKKDDVKNKAFIRCFKQYDLYNASIYRYTNNMKIFLQIAISRKIVSLVVLQNILKKIGFAIN